MQLFEKHIPFLYYIFTVENVVTKPKVPFMDDIHSEMIFNPGEEPDDFDDKIFPNWEKFKKTTQLIDPVNKKCGSILEGIFNLV